MRVSFSTSPCCFNGSSAATPLPTPGKTGRPRGTRSRAYSGRLLLRMPQSLHSDLAEAAEREQVSLNAYINSLLVAARGSGLTEGASAADVASSPQAAAPSADELAHSARLQRFLALALGANPEAFRE